MKIIISHMQRHDDDLVYEIEDIGIINSNYRKISIDINRANVK